MERFVIDESPDFFGPLYPFIADDSITDIDLICGRKRIWLTDTDNNRFPQTVENLDESFVEEFSIRISNAVSMPFHKQRPVLEAETASLRITIVHESVSIAGRSVSIRKSAPAVRLSKKEMIRDGYATEEMIRFLEDAVRARANLVFCGEPGVGKTECAKYFSGYIPENERIVTIEDTPEWHLARILPEGDVVELRVGEIMDYSKAIKTSLRLNPKWMMVSEVRSVEVRFLIESLSTGVRGMTTLHTDDVRSLPDRIVNMAGEENIAGRLKNDVYNFVDIGVLIRRGLKRGSNGIENICRYIDQICVYERIEGENRITMLYDEGKTTGESIPARLKHRMYPDTPIPIPTVDFCERRGTYLGAQKQII